MKDSNENTKSPDAEPAPKGTSTRRTFLKYALAAGGAKLIPGCAATPDKPTAGEAIDETDQLRELGAESVGLQPDGSVVQYGVGESFGKATNKAIRRAEVILGEGDFNFIFSKPLKRPDGKLIVYVRAGEGELVKTSEANDLPGINPETRKKMIEFHRKTIYYLNKEAERYKRKYGDRIEFAYFESKVEKRIISIEYEIMDLRTGKIKDASVIKNRSIDESAFTKAEAIISMCDKEAGLLSVFERADEDFLELDKKMDRLK